MVALNEGLGCGGGGSDLLPATALSVTPPTDPSNSSRQADRAESRKKKIKVKLVMQPGLADRGREGLFFFLFCNIDELSAARSDSSRAGKEEEQKT